MQRRAGKPLAHIHVPPSPAFARMQSDDKSPAPGRLSQKSLGLTHRIWLILLAVLALVVLTRITYPPDVSSPRHRILHTDLKPKNYLNLSDHDIPFPFCPGLGAGDKLASKYDAVTLYMTRFHLGSGARVQRVINKALAGLPVTISVIGGSVSACHGAGDDPLSPTCWPSLFFNWWTSVFPHPATELTNGAMRRTSSSYFGFCNAHHIPDITDLVIVELDVDDANTNASLDEFELLIRSILIRPDAPAVVILGHFSPQVAQAGGFASGDHWHSVVSHYYDVPYVSTKPVLYPKYIADPSSIDRFFTDPILANTAGHEVLADVLTSYFQLQVCTTWAAITGHSPEILPSHAAPAHTDGQAKRPTDARGLFGGVAQRKGAAGAAAPDVEQAKKLGAAAIPAGVTDRESSSSSNSRAATQDPHFRVPPSRINQRPSDLAVSPFEEVAPYCVSANDLVNPLPISMFAGSGWVAFHPPPGSAELSSHAHYFYSSLPTSKLRVNIQVGEGDVAVYYVKEPAHGGENGSAVECWVDDNYEGAQMIENAGDVGEPTPTLAVIDRQVARGPHYVECLLMGEEDARDTPPFKIIGIFAT